MRISVTITIVVLTIALIFQTISLQMANREAAKWREQALSLNREWSDAFSKMEEANENNKITIARYQEIVTRCYGVK